MAAIGPLEPNTSIHTKRGRSWPVTIAGLLLVLQAVFLLLLSPTLLAIDFAQRPEAGLILFFPPEGGVIVPQIKSLDLSQLNFAMVFPENMIAISPQVVTSFIFLVLSPLVLIAGVLFLTTWRRSWTIALFLQAVIISISLWIYFNFHHPYVNLIMINCIFLVFYLNLSDIQIAFRGKSLNALQP
jgi:hypothetical protein